MQKKQLILIIAFLFTALCSISQTYFRGAERMCWTTKDGKVECYDAPRKWYHLNTVMIDKDSIYVYKVPVKIEKKDTSYSASDGGYYYYYGILRQTDTAAIAYMTSYNCD